MLGQAQKGKNSERVSTNPCLKPATVFPLPVTCGTLDLMREYMTRFLILFVAISPTRLHISPDANKGPLFSLASKQRSRSSLPSLDPRIMSPDMVVKQILFGQCSRLRFVFVLWFSKRVWGTASSHLMQRENTAGRIQGT